MLSVHYVRVCQTYTMFIVTTFVASYSGFMSTRLRHEMSVNLHNDAREALPGFLLEEF
jgi:hypothetical protein